MVQQYKQNPQPKRTNKNMPETRIIAVYFQKEYWPYWNKSPYWNIKGFLFYYEQRY